MFRKFELSDDAVLREEIAQDPVHGNDPAFTPEVFHDPRSQNLVFEDESVPVMFVNLRREVRLTIQFCKVDKDRIRKTFEQYIPTFAAAYKQAGCGAFVFTTKSKPLAWFLRRFGFRAEVVQRKVL